MSEPAVPVMAPAMLIAGGSGSIGRALGGLAAAVGWRVAIHGRRAERVEAALADLPAEGHSGHVADFADGAVIAALVAEVAARHGRIDAVVDCSVGGPSGIAGSFAETRPEVFTAFAGQSVVAFQRLAHAALPHLSARGGALVALVSDAGIFAAPRQTLIGAMRAATIGFVRNLALEVARDGVRVHAVSPSYVEQTGIAARLEAASAERMAKARKRAGLGLPNALDVARLALFLCGPDSARITGQVISINGGLNA